MIRTRTTPLTGTDRRVSLNRFITIEGGEGVGKSLFCSNLLAKLQSHQEAVISTREPGGSQLAEKIRQLFIAPTEGESLSPEAELFLLSAARSQHVGQLILPSLKQGKWVLCDRFADSTRVYQGAMAGIEEGFLEQVIERSTQGLNPRLSFLLDCPVELALSRIAQRSQSPQTSRSEASGAERYDQAAASWHQRLRTAYLQLAQRFPDRVYVLDASQAPDRVVDQAFTQIKKVFHLE